MSKPTTAIFPIQNGKLFNALDCNSFQLLNLDTSNLAIGGGSGNDTGTTTAILKGDGNHGFANAIAGTDYATAVSVTNKEDQSAHDADIATLTTDISTLTASVAANTAAVATKADATATTTSLGLKADDSVLQAYITSNDAAVAGMAMDISDLTTLVGNKADAASTSTALAGKEPLLPTTVNDRYILARRNSSGTDAWFFVDPVTLGTTSQTFANGQSFTNTNYDSATANFVTDDIGKTIISSGVIPADTTIVSITSATRVVLSAATLSTATGETFTIINRLLNNNVGTVTSVSFTNNVPNLFANTSGIANPTSSPTLTLNPATVGANTFYGNGANFTTTPGFMVASVARTALGGTTAGQALFQLANPSAISFPQFTAINGAITRTPAQVLSDIGGENALTFNAPLSRSINSISIPAATNLVSGHLTSTDWVTFSGKLSSGRTITTTAPLRIDGLGSANLSADRTLSMAAASGNANGTLPVDGYLKGTDFISFLNNVPNTRTIGVGNVPGNPLSITNNGQLSANLTLSISAASSTTNGYLTSLDYNSFAAGAGKSVSIAAEQGPSVTLANTIPPITRIVLGTSGTQLTAAMTITLPLASGYSATLNNPPIEIVDVLTNGFQTATNRLTIARAGSDLIDGVTSFQLSQGQKYLRFNSDGGARWTTTKYFVDSFRDPSDGTKQARIAFPVSFPTATTRNISIGVDGDMAIPLQLADANGQVVRGLDSNGNLIVRPLTATEIVPTEFAITTDANAIVTPGSSIDTVKLNVAITATRTCTLPDTTGYSSGEKIFFYNSVPPATAQTIRFISANNNTFNGNNNIDVLLDPMVGNGFVYRVFTADPTAPGNWTVPTFGGGTGSGLSLDTWHTASVASGIATLSCTPNVVSNNHIVNMSGDLTLAMTGTTPIGSTGRIKFRDSTGNHTVTVPQGAKAPTGSGAAGTFKTSTGTAVEDEYIWDYDGQFFNFMPTGVNMIPPPPPSFSTQSDIGPAASGSSQKNSDLIAHRYQASSFVACGGTFPTCLTAPATYLVGKANLRLFKTGSPTNNVFCAIHADNGSNKPALTPLAVSNAVLASSLATSEGTVSFTGLSVTLTAGTRYWVVYYSDVVGRSISDGGISLGSSTVTSTAQAQFSSADVGNSITGTGIPSGTVIQSVTNTTSAVMSQNATVTTIGTAALSIGDANNVNYTRWMQASTTGLTNYGKATTGNWSALQANQQFLFTLFK